LGTKIPQCKWGGIYAVMIDLNHHITSLIVLSKKVARMIDNDLAHELMSSLIKTKMYEVFPKEQGRAP
jgi:hypothetical protein